MRGARPIASSDDHSSLWGYDTSLENHNGFRNPKAGLACDSPSRFLSSMSSRVHTCTCWRHCSSMELIGCSFYKGLPLQRNHRLRDRRQTVLVVYRKPSSKEVKKVRRPALGDGERKDRDLAVTGGGAGSSGSTQRRTRLFFSRKFKGALFVVWALVVVWVQFSRKGLLSRRNAVARWQSWVETGSYVNVY